MSVAQPSLRNLAPRWPLWVHQLPRKLTTGAAALPLRADCAGTWRRPSGIASVKAVSAKCQVSGPLRKCVAAITVFLALLDRSDC